MENDELELGERAGRKTSKKWHRRIAVTCILMLAAIWIAYMPVQPYRPFCSDFAAYKEYKFYDSRLSGVYQKALKSYLWNTKTPYIDIGDIILVPVIENGHDQNAKGFFHRIISAVFDQRRLIWSQANSKIAYNAVYWHLKENPSGKIARMDFEYMEAMRGTYPKILGSKNRARLRCDLIEAVANPNLK